MYAAWAPLVLEPRGPSSTLTRLLLLLLGGRRSVRVLWWATRLLLLAVGLGRWLVLLGLSRATGLLLCRSLFLLVVGFLLGFVFFLLIFLLLVFLLVFLLVLLLCFVAVGFFLLL